MRVRKGARIFGIILAVLMALLMLLFTVLPYIGQ